MLNIDFPCGSFDIIWSEGSIYAVGFEKGLVDWKKFIKTGGFLVVHEMTWLKKDPPNEMKNYWEKMYPGITTIDKNLKIIKKCGYKILDFFSLPEDFWWYEYYKPLEDRLQTLRIKYKGDVKRMSTIEKEQGEIDLYKKYYQYFGSVFFIMQKA